MRVYPELHNRSMEEIQHSEHTVTGNAERFDKVFTEFMDDFEQNHKNTLSPGNYLGIKRYLFSIFSSEQKNLISHLENLLASLRPTAGLQHMATLRNKLKRGLLKSLERIQSNNTNRQFQQKLARPPKVVVEAEPDEQPAYYDDGIRVGELEAVGA